MKKIFFVLIAVAFIFSACQQKEEAKTEVPAETVKSEVVEIIDPWIRPSASGTNTALFFRVYNNTGQADTLYDAASEMAKKVEVHETYIKEGDMMGMRHVDYVVIADGDTVVFKPRDLHVMLMKLNNDVLIGDTGTVALMFKNAGNIEVKGVVKGMH